MVSGRNGTINGYGKEFITRVYSSANFTDEDFGEIRVKEGDALVIRSLNKIEKMNLSDFYQKLCLNTMWPNTQKA